MKVTSIHKDRKRAVAISVVYLWIIMDTLICERKNMIVVDRYFLKILMKAICVWMILDFGGFFF